MKSILIENDLIRKRISKTRRIGKMLMILPFVRCVILNGSLTSGKSKPSSDIDILIIAKSGRVFTCRFFVNALTSIFGIKRSKDDSKPHAGKFCFNYFLTDNYLKIPTGRGEKIDKYCAENYSKSRFVAGDNRLFEKFMGENQSLFKTFSCQPYLSNRHSSESWNPGSRFRIIRLAFGLPRRKSGMTRAVQRIAECLFVNQIEKNLKNYQIKLINRDLRTKKYPDLIVFKDKELRFHPPR